MSHANRLNSKRAHSAMVLALTLVAGSPLLAAARFNPVCGNGTIAGTYGIQIQGTRAVPENLGGGTEAVVGVVVRTYDGRGRFEQVGNVRGAVTGMPVDAPGSGTYLISPNCNGRTSFQPFGPAGPTIVEHLVIVRDGQEIRTITAPGGPMITGIHQHIGSD